MAIIVDYPPLFDEIDAAFRVKGKAVIYSWCGDIYNPMDIEIPAHQAELQYLVEHAPNRNARRVALKHVAIRLASPLYGKMISVGAAKKRLIEE